MPKLFQANLQICFANKRKQTALHKLQFYKLSGTYGPASLLIEKDGGGDGGRRVGGDGGDGREGREGDQVRNRYRNGTLSLQRATLLSISFFIVVLFSV